MATQTSIIPARIKIEVDPLLDGLKGIIPPQPMPLYYTLALFFVALGMLTLPVIYLGMIGGVGWLFYNQAAFVFGFGPRVAESPGFWSLVWLVALGIAMLFMIKPFLAPALKMKKAKPLYQKAEPRLFAFVERICIMVGAPMPSEIRVDSDVNASASFGSGPLGFFGDKLVLTIGLPLVAGLDVRQFAGVLAHEMGHFAQRAGMRLNYVIRTMNIWFLRVVFERDVWDLRLEEWSANPLLILVVWPARLIIKGNRFVLFLLMLAGNALSCFLARQMEYDADRYEAHIAGSDMFVSTSKRIRELSIASFGAQHDLTRFWDEGRLPDDLASLIVKNAKEIPPEVLKNYERHAKFQRTGIFDTHPSDQDRASNVRRLDTPGLYHPEPPAPPPAAASFPAPAALKDTFSFDAAPMRKKAGKDPFSFNAPASAAKMGKDPFAFDAPAKPGQAALNQPAMQAPPSKGKGPSSSVMPAAQRSSALPPEHPAKSLLKDFRVLTRTVSFEYYQAVLGKKVGSSHLHAFDDLVKRQEGELAGEKALLRYFQGPLVDGRSLKLSHERLQPVQDSKAALAAMRSSREDMVKAVAAFAFARRRYLDAEERLNHQRQAGVLIELGLPLEVSSLGIHGSDSQAVAEAQRTQRAVIDKETPKLDALETPACRRLVAGLCLLQSSVMDGRIPDLGKLRDETAMLWVQIGILEELLTQLAELRDRYHELTVLFPLMDNNSEHPVLVEKIIQNAERLHGQLTEISKALGAERYPFDHAKGDITLKEFAIPEIPSQRDIGAVMHASGEAFAKLAPLYTRLLGRLALAAEMAETALGLPLLRDPKPEVAQRN